MRQKKVLQSDKAATSICVDAILVEEGIYHETPHEPADADRVSPSSQPEIRKPGGLYLCL